MGDLNSESVGFQGGTGRWAPDPTQGSALLRWFVDEIPSEWVAERAYPSMDPQSEPYKSPASTNHSRPESALHNQAIAPSQSHSRSPTNEQIEVLKRRQTALKEATSTSLAAAAKKTSDLKRAQQSFQRNIAARRQALEEAKSGNKLASVGIVRRVALYEDRIELPGEVHELTPEVRAKTDQFGDKDVVQGWVVKTTHDRREVHLSVEGPDWNSVVSFRMDRSWSDTNELHHFSAKVNQAAKNSDHARTVITSRVVAARSALISALTSTGTSRGPAEDASTMTLVQLQDMAESLANAAKAVGEPESRSGRRVVKSAIEKSRSLVAPVERQLSELKSISSTFAQEISDASKEAEMLRMANTSTARPEPDPAPVEEEPARAAGSTSPPTADGRLAKLRELKELRDILTEEEFEAEKTRILSGD